MNKIGTLRIEGDPQMQREDGVYALTPGVYTVYFALNEQGVGGYMAEVLARSPEGFKTVIVLGGGWFSATSSEVPNFHGIGLFEPTADELPVVGTGTRLVAKQTQLQ